MDIRIQNVTKSFGSLRANDSVSLHFAAGQIHGVLGENGAGKSTLMKLLSGFLRRDSGQIVLNEEPAQLATPAAALQAGIGMIHQDPLDVPAFTALENFFCASPRQSMPTIQTARRLLLDLSQRLNFAVAPDAPVARLTVGQRQQLEILRLLAHGVQVLILDEPTTGITAAQKTALFAALGHLAEEGKTVLFVSHKLEEVAELCHTVSVLRAGQVMGECPMLMPQPQDKLLALMFGHDLPQRQPASRASSNGTPAAEEETSPAPPVWQLEGIEAREGSRTLHNLNMTLPAGTVIGLSGLEGSGQHVFLRLLAGLLHPDEGRLLLNGKDMSGRSVATFQQAGVHYLPADRMAEGLVGVFSLADHLALAGASSSSLIRRGEAQSAARSAIDDYDIKATPTTPIAALSGGNQQRAMLALLPPHCSGLLLDQPTRGLDVISAQAVWQRLLARRDDGTALVFASADFDELLDYSDYVLVFYSGRVSRLLPRADLSGERLAELIGGVGFEAANE
jgi:simple sugar transport system ATP-binding protein